MWNTQLARFQKKLGQIDGPFLISVEQGTRVILFGILVVIVSAALLHQGLSILHPYSLDYGEAPLIDQAVRLWNGKNIYRNELSHPPYTISNYPPGYVALLAPFMGWFGPNFWSGRLISSLCGLASGLFVVLILHTLTRDRTASTAGGLIFLSIPFVVKWSAFLRVDMLALALSLAGLYLLVRQPHHRGLLCVGALFLVASIYTRQSYALAAPLAGFVWLLFRDWRRALMLAGIVGGVSLALFILLNLITRGGFYFNVVTANVNEFGIERLKWNLRNLREVMPVLLIIGGASFFLSPRKLSTWPFVSPYLVGAALSALTIGKIGSNVNYFLELSAAVSLAAGALIAWTRPQAAWRLLRVVVFGLLIYQCGILLDKVINQVIPELTDRRSELVELRRLENLVAATPGPVLADEYMGMIILAGRPLEIQPFEVTQLANAGLWDQSPLIEAIEKKEYPLILLYDFWGDGLLRERWTKDMLFAIQMNYRITERLGGTRVYRPEGIQSSQLDHDF